ncbi:hypothetical protein GBAR_LOCUS6948 [Geodia barretti]|uniref:Uncharacterized protein n=1 Tax=Geodia barretti TaxID=519541 RepID=A0AA35WDH5_GEOBA|nr:hypothetical protein GBAR_LOCUS6948 [Geodia barretti]
MSHFLRCLNVLACPSLATPFPDLYNTFISPKCRSFFLSTVTRSWTEKEGCRPCLVSMEQGCQEVPNLSPYNSTGLCQSQLLQSSRELTASLLTRPFDCLSRTSNQTRRRKRLLSCFQSTDECLTCRSIQTDAMLPLCTCVRREATRPFPASMASPPTRPANHSANRSSLTKSLIQSSYKTQTNQPYIIVVTHVINYPT